MPSNTLFTLTTLAFKLSVHKAYPSHCVKIFSIRSRKFSFTVSHFQALVDGQICKQGYKGLTFLESSAWRGIHILHGNQVLATKAERLCLRSLSDLSHPALSMYAATLYCIMQLKLRCIITCGNYMSRISQVFRMKDLLVVGIIFISVIKKKRLPRTSFH